MEERAIDSRSYTVAQLFGEEGRYRFDSYQREYDWQREEVQQLLYDLGRRFEQEWRPDHDRSETTRYAPYFLGPYVFFRHDGINYLVDGQQRITTLHLLLIHLRNLLQDAHPSDAQALERHIRTSKFGHQTFSVDVRERVPVLESLMDGQGRPYVLPPDATPSVRNLLERSRDLEQDFPPALLNEALPYFHDWLLHRVFLVGIEALDRSHGWEIFETMNDRGTRLTPFDLLKSFLLGKAEPNRRRRLNEAWRGMLTRLHEFGNSTPSDFAETVLLARHADLRTGSEDARNIERSFHEWIRTHSRDLGLAKPSEYASFITGHLVPLSDRYCLLLRAAERFDADLPAVFYNRVNGIRHQHRLIMAAARADEPPADFKSKARLISGYLDLRFVHRLINGHTAHSSDLDPEIHELIPVIRNCASPQEVADVLGARVSADAFPDFTTFGLGSDNRRQVHYLLARLTAFVEVATSNPDRSADYLGERHDYQIEHIWSNTYERYRDLVANRRDFDAWRNRLGGLLLLHRSDNASYRDAPYSTKVEHYQRQSAIAASLHKNAHSNNPRLSKFAKAHGLADLFRPFPDDFDKEAIKIRQRLYHRLAELVWDPARLGLTVPESGRRRKIAEQRTRAFYGVDVQHLLEAGLLQPGTTLVGRKRSEEFTAIVLADGRIRVESGEVFTSLSRAGAFVKGIKSCAGWDFWHIRTDTGDITLRELRTDLLRSVRTQGDA